MPAHVRPVTDERDALLAFLDHQRAAVCTTAYGLTDIEAAATPSASALSVGAIVKHLASAERSWAALVAQQPRRQGEREYAEGLTMTPADTLDELLADYATAAEETDKVVAAVDDLGQAVPVPRGVPWMPQDVEAWSVRWVLLHLIEETARHAGHADIVRESIDGAAAVSLLAAAENWPDQGWIRPWRRAAVQEGER